MNPSQQINRAFPGAPTSLTSRSSPSVLSSNPLYVVHTAAQQHTIPSLHAEGNLIRTLLHSATKVANKSPSAFQPHAFMARYPEASHSISASQYQIPDHITSGKYADMFALDTLFALSDKFAFIRLKPSPQNIAKMYEGKFTNFQNIPSVLRSMQHSPTNSHYFFFFFVQ